MAADYITISEAGGLTKKFELVQLKPIIDPGKTVTNTLDGGRDIAYGGVRESHRIVLRIEATEERSGYGTIANIQVMIKRTDPNATPGVRFTYTDNWGVAHSNACFGPGPIGIEFASTIIDGDSSIYYFPLEILF